MCFVFFFFKQKTAYELRISYWSSDVCSSESVAEHRRDRFVYPPGPVRRPAVYLQGDGDTHAVAGRDRRGSGATGHRPDREEVDGDRRVRIHPLAFTSWRIADHIQGRRRGAFGAVARAVVDRKSARLNSRH